MCVERRLHFSRKHECEVVPRRTTLVTLLRRYVHKFSTETRRRANAELTPTISDIGDIGERSRMCVLGYGAGDLAQLWPHAEENVAAEPGTRRLQLRHSLDPNMRSRPSHINQLSVDEHYASRCTPRNL